MLFKTSDAMWLRLIFCSLLLVVLAACSPSAAAPAPTRLPTPTSSPTDAFTLLHQRTLDLPRLLAGSACPRDPGRKVSPDLGPALGKGPIYLVGYGVQATISYYGGRQDGGWYYLKTLWAAPPGFQDLFLVRGRQINGPNELLFSKGFTASPDQEAEFSSEEGGSTPSGWVPWANYVRVRAPGCYAVQVDGLHFSEVISFQVVDTPQQ